MADIQLRRVGRPRKSEAGDTRATLLAAALELFVNQGFAATSVRMIARAAGLSDGGLYAHFPNKQAIYDELVADAGPGAVDEIVAELLPDSAAVPDDPAVFLAEVVARIMAHFDTDGARQFSKLLLREEIPNDPSVVAGMIGKGSAAMAELFEAWAQRGMLAEPIVERIRGGALTGATLTWELLAPLAFVRLVYLHGSAELRREGQHRVDAHLAFYLGSVLG
jgi:AcrR family transcriptional regulator